MSLRGRGRGRGGGGGRGWSRSFAKQLPFERFPEIEGIGVAKPSRSKIQLIKWSDSLQTYCNSSPYYYEDRSKRIGEVIKPCIETYSDRNLQTTKARRPISDFIKLDTDHVPAELARPGEKKVKRVEKVSWNVKPESQTFEVDFRRLEKKYKGQEVKEKIGKDEDDDEDKEKKENEDGEEIVTENEDDEEQLSDQGDYAQNEYFDDDEDDYNMVDDGEDGPLYQ